MRKGIEFNELKPLIEKGLRNREVMKILNRTKGSIRAAMLKYGLKFKRYTREERLADYKRKAKEKYHQKFKKRRNSPRDMKSLIGQTFGYLTILRVGEVAYWKNKNGVECKSSTWDCICECGKEINIRHSNLVYNSTRSCGCKTVELFLDKYKNYSEIHHPNTVETYLYNIYRVNGRKWAGGFNLSFEDFSELISSHCYYCGLPPFQVRWNHNKTKSKELGGIDRLDSSIGYEISNIVPCCVHCNRAKMNRNEEDFKNWVKLIYNNLYNNVNDCVVQSSSQEALDSQRNLLEHP